VTDMTRATDEIDSLVRRILSLNNREILDLSTAELQMRQYVSAPLCVIDAVFSLGVHYKSVENVVDRFCKRYHWRRFDGVEHTVSELVAILAPFESRFDEIDVFRNKQRTSPRSGITKAEAVYRFAKVLQSHGVQTFSDVSKKRHSPSLQATIRSIPGQASGLSYNYFLMLAGHFDVVKGDRMVRRFVSDAIGRAVSQGDAERLVISASDELKEAFPHLNAAILDNVIWGYQSGERVGCG
jgi:hypothetical protein